MKLAGRMSIKKKILIFGILIFLGNSCALLLKPNTPKGIDPAPLYNLQIPDSINIDVGAFAIIFSNDSALAKKYHFRLGESKRAKWIHIYDTTDHFYGFLKSIEIQRFEKDSDALNYYLNFKGTCKSGFYYRLYKSKKQSNNRYFMTYATTQIDRCHGIPCGLYNDPDLELGFLLHKYVVSISYSEFFFDGKEKQNYKQIINNDIILISKMFTDIIKQVQNGE